MSASQETKPRISLDLLGRMLERLTPEELAVLPVRKLPEQIPAQWLASLSPEHLAAVRRILAQRIESPVAREDAEPEPDTAKVASIDSAPQGIDRLPAALRILQRDLTDLSDLIHRWRNNLYAEVEVRALDPGLRFDRDAARGNDSRRTSKASPMERKHQQVTELLRGLQADFEGLFQAEWVLQARIKEGEDGDGRLALALNNLRTTIAPLEELLARYHTLNLTIAHHEMSTASNQILATRRRREELEKQIEQLRLQMRRRAGWLRSNNKRESNERLNQEISELMRQLNGCEFSVRREQILRWLALYVEVALNPGSRKMAQRRLGEVRDMLARLINEFCHQVEQLANNYSGRVAPANPVQLLRSFFKTRGNEPVLGLGAPAVQISTDLLRVEKELGAAITLAASRR